MRIALYVHFDGRCEEAIAFYSRIFECKELMKQVYTEKDTDDANLVGKVFHAEIQIGDFYLYMTDNPTKGSKDAFDLVFEVPTKDEAQTIFHKLSADGEIFQEIRKMSYGPEIGFLKDKFGINWDVVVSG